MRLNAITVDLFRQCPQIERSTNGTTLRSGHMRLEMIIVRLLVPITKRFRGETSITKLRFVWKLFGVNAIHVMLERFRRMEFGALARWNRTFQFEDVRFEVVSAKFEPRWFDMRHRVVLDNIRFGTERLTAQATEPDGRGCVHCVELTVEFRVHHLWAVLVLAICRHFQLIPSRFSCL